MNRIIYSLTIASLFIMALSAQDISPSLTNYFRYGNGEREFGTSGSRQTYFENLTDARITLPENFIVGFRLLYDDPPEIGESFTGIKRRFIEYDNNGIYLRAGNSSSLFGRGLAFNLFENRGLAYDTWLDGIKASYENELLKATLVGGTIDFRDSITIERNEEYKIRGGNFEINPLDYLSIGAGFIYADGKMVTGKEEAAPAIDIKAEIPELYLSLNLEDISFYIDWSHKWTNVITDNITSSGSGLYSALSYTGSGFGVTVDYKNYRFDERDPYGRFDNSRATRMLPFQNPPIVQREHSFTLLSRALHEVDFNDEVGLQIEAFYSVDDNITLIFNTSLSSIHNRYELNEDGFTFTEVKRSSNFLPSPGKEYFPYFEAFLEGEYFYSLTSAIRGGFAFREKTFFNEFSSNQSSVVTQSIVVPVQAQHIFSPDFSATLQSEHEWVNESFENEDTKFFNHLITVLASVYSTLTLGLRYEYTTTEFDVSGKKSWLLGEIGYRLGQAHVISLSYGRERGGQICANGICRYIQPFNGFRVSILSQI